MDKIIYEVPLYNKWGDKIQALTEQGRYTVANFMLACNKYEQEYIQNGCLPAPFEFPIESAQDLLEISDYVAFSKDDIDGDVQFPCVLRILTTTSYLGWFPVVNAPSVSLVWNENVDGEEISREVHGQMFEAKGYDKSSPAYADGIPLGNFHTKRDTLDAMAKTLVENKVVASAKDITVEWNTQMSVEATYYNQITDCTVTVMVEWDNLIPW